MSGQDYFETLGVIRDGKLTVTGRKTFEEAMQRFPDGEVTVRVEKLQRHRTSKQNRFFHGPILTAFMDLGYHKQEAKDMLCLMFIPQEVRMPDGSMVRVPGHTAALNVKDFNALIDSCIQLAAENDIVIEDSDQWRKQSVRGVA